MVENCPDCEYTSESRQGVKIHYGKIHEGTISGVVVACEQCDKSVRKEEYRIERSNNLFCSTSCHDVWRSDNVSGEDAGGWDNKTIYSNCDYCDDGIELYKCRASEHRHHFCDQECYVNWQIETGMNRGENHPFFGVTGEDHPGWKGGHDQSWRREPRWRITARQVYYRDDHTCQKCGDADVELHAHHVVPVSEGGDRFNRGNLVTLCYECHYDEHTTDT